MKNNNNNGVLTQDVKTKISNLQSLINENNIDMNFANKRGLIDVIKDIQSQNIEYNKEINSLLVNEILLNSLNSVITDYLTSNELNNIELNNIDLTINNNQFVLSEQNYKLDYLDINAKYENLLKDYEVLKTQKVVKTRNTTGTKKATSEPKTYIIVTYTDSTTIKFNDYKSFYESQFKTKFEEFIFTTSKGIEIDYNDLLEQYNSKWTTNCFVLTKLINQVEANKDVKLSHLNIFENYKKENSDSVTKLLLNDNRFDNIARIDYYNMSKQELHKEFILRQPSA